YRDPGRQRRDIVIGYCLTLRLDEAGLDDRLSFGCALRGSALPREHVIVAKHELVAGRVMDQRSERGLAALDERARKLLEPWAGAPPESQLKRPSLEHIALRSGIPRRSRHDQRHGCYRQQRNNSLQHRLRL